MKKIIVDDMLLTKDLPTTAGSKMLEGYMSLFEAEAISRLNGAGYTISGKAEVGEFAIDLIGETNYKGAFVKKGKLASPVAEMLEGDAEAAVCMDVNGSVRRAAAQNSLVSIKPTYGTVSRFGTVPVACSGETVSVMAKSADNCEAVLSIIAGHDDKDGTSLSDEDCAKAKEVSPVRRIAVLGNMLKDTDLAVARKIEIFRENLAAKGIEVCEINSDVIAASSAAWNVLMCAELCNNVSRYDGVKYGYRAENFSGIDELYTNSRTEAFGELLKCAILFGSDTLSTENYMKVYDKSLRVRRVVSEAFNALFEQYDAVMMPACSSFDYSEDIEDTAVFEENYYTAPASITGLPAVVIDGVQLVGKAFSEGSLLAFAKEYEKEAK